MLKQQIFTYTIVTLISVLITFSWEYSRETKFKATFETHPIISTNISKSDQNYDYGLETLLLTIHNNNHTFLRDHLLDNFRKSETIKNPRFVSIRDNDMTYFIFTMEMIDLENAKKEIFNQINSFQSFIKERTIQLSKQKINTKVEDNNPIFIMLDVAKEALNNKETYVEVLNLIKEYSNEIQSENNESNMKIDKLLIDLKQIYNNLDKKNNNQKEDIKKKLEKDLKIQKLNYEKVLNEIEKTDQFFIFQNLQFQSNKNYPLSLILSIIFGLAASFLFFEIFRKKTLNRA